MNESFDTIDELACAAYAEHGVICLRGIFTDWIEALRELLIELATNHAILPLND